MVMTSGLSASAWSIASLPLVAVPTTWIVGSAERISETRRRKKPESSTTRTLTAINTPLGGATRQGAPPKSNTPRGVTLEHARDVENQRNAPVAGDGGPGH